MYNLFLLLGNPCGVRNSSWGFHKEYHTPQGFPTRSTSGNLVMRGEYSSPPPRPTRRGRVFPHSPPRGDYFEEFLPGKGGSPRGAGIPFPICIPIRICQAFYSKKLAIGSQNQHTIARLISPGTGF